MPCSLRRWGVSLPGRTAPIRSAQQQNALVRNWDEEEEDSVCRVCWQVQDTDRGGELLSPCRCSGSIRYIHRRCLGAWQRTQRSQGALRKSYKCDICKERYRFRRAPFSGAKVIGLQLPTIEEARELLYSILGSPAWQVVIDVWKIIVLANGLHKGIVRGVQGFELGVRFGLKCFVEYFKTVGVCYPLILLMGTLCSSLELPALLVTVVVTASISAQMLVSAIIGFYGGALIGFAHGSFQIFRGTWQLTRAILCSGVGLIAVTAGGTVKKSFGFLNGLLPFLHHFFFSKLLTRNASTAEA